MQYQKLHTHINTSDCDDVLQANICIQVRVIEEILPANVQSTQLASNKANKEQTLLRLFYTGNRQFSWYVFKTYKKTTNKPLPTQ